MFLTEEQAAERLNSEKNLARRFSKAPEIIEERTIHLPGKKPGSSNLSVETRTEIAIETRLGKNQAEVAAERGLAVPTVQKIESGKTQGIDEENVAEVITSVRDRALDRLMHSLGLLSDDKLSGCSAKDLSVIASNMGRVVEKITPKETAPDHISFIIYSPELKKESAFKTLEV